MNTVLTLATAISQGDIIKMRKKNCRLIRVDIKPSLLNKIRWKVGYILFLSVLFWGISTPMMAQEGSLQTSFSPPTARSLVKTAKTPVSLYTGTPAVNIPLYKAESRSSSVQISLNYQSDGTKVTKIPSWVGLGWALKSGGVITRKVQNRPDDGGGGYLDTADRLEDYLQNPNQHLEYLTDLEIGSVDSEPDEFYFNLPRASGKFMFDHDGEAILRNLKPYDIDYSRGTKNFDGRNFSTITKWTITTPDGTQYVFSSLEFEENATVQLVTQFTMPHVISWYLTKIIPPNGKDIVRFKYTNPVTFLRATQNYREKYFGANGYCDVSSSNRTLTFSYQMKYGLIWLKEIVTAQDSIVFDSSPRGSGYLDSHEHQLDQIKVYEPEGSLKKRFQFSYFAFSDRLMLNSVTEIGNGSNSLPPYQFEYDTSPSLPGRLSNSVDHWGYYNGKANSTLLPTTVVNTGGATVDFSGANREPNASSGSSGILTKVTYPTGGFTKFEYEGHDHGKVSSDLVSNSSSPQQEELWASGFNDTQEQNILLSSSTNEDISLTIDYELEVPAAVLQGTHPYVELVEVSGGSDRIFREYGDPNGGTVSGSEVFNLPPGTYKIRAVSRSPNTTANIETDWTNIVAAKNKPAGGVRVKKIIEGDGVSSSNDVITEYNYRLKSDPERSSGVLVMEPDYAFYSSSEDNGTLCSYVSISAFSYTPLVDKSSHIGYGEVEVLHGLNGVNGKERHYFIAADDVSDDPIPANAWPHMLTTSFDHLRGRKVRVDTRNSSGTLVQRNTTSYTSATSRKVLDYLKFKKGPKDFSSSRAMMTAEYQQSNDWRGIGNNTKTEYNPSSGTSISSSTEYEFNDSSHLQPTKITRTNSDGQVRKTIYEYAHEDEYPGMESEHMLSQPYKVTIKDGSGNTLTINWTLWDLYNGSWQPCAQWTGGPELGTANPPDC